MAKYTLTYQQMDEGEEAILRLPVSDLGDLLSYVTRLAMIVGANPDEDMAHVALDEAEWEDLGAIAGAISAAGREAYDG